MSSATSSGGSFVTPYYLQQQYGLWRTYPPSFYEQSVQLHDPGYGLEIEVPLFDPATPTGQQVSENSGIDNSSPGGHTRPQSWPPRRPRRT